jgi:hypothetical protein
MPPKQIRKAARLPLIAVAVGARVSETTARVYEADRDSVNAESRARLDAFYAKLHSRAGNPSEPPHHAA